MNHIKILILSITLCSGVTGDTRNVKPSITAEYNQFLDLNPIAAEFAKHYANISDIGLALPNVGLPSPQDLKCLSDMSQLIKGLTSGNLWALRSKWKNPSYLIFV